MHKIINQKEHTSKTTPKIYATEKEEKNEKPSVFGTGNLFCMPEQVCIMISVMLSKLS